MKDRPLDPPNYNRSKNQTQTGQNGATNSRWTRFWRTLARTPRRSTRPVLHVWKPKLAPLTFYNKCQLLWNIGRRYEGIRQVIVSVLLMSHSPLKAQKGKYDDTSQCHSVNSLDRARICASQQPQSFLKLHGCGKLLTVHTVCPFKDWLYWPWKIRVIDAGKMYVQSAIFWCISMHHLVKAKQIRQILYLHYRHVHMQQQDSCWP